MPMLREEMVNQGFDPDLEANFLDDDSVIMSVSEVQAEVEALADRTLPKRSLDEQIKSWFADPRSEICPNDRRENEGRDSARIQEHTDKVNRFVAQLEKYRYSEDKLPPHNGKLKARSLEKEKIAWAKNVQSLTQSWCGIIHSFCTACRPNENELLRILSGTAKE